MTDEEYFYYQEPNGDWYELPDINYQILIINKDENIFKLYYN